MLAANVFRKLDVELKPDPSRTVIRPFGFTYPDAFRGNGETREQKVVERLMALDPDFRSRMWNLLGAAMRERHRDADRVFLRRYAEVRGDDEVPSVSEERDRLLIGAYLSEEFAFESAALFNPSIIRNPVRPFTPEGRIRFLLSLRGIGEGHVSSVTFRTGSWDGDERIAIDAPSQQGVPPQVEVTDREGWVRLICPDAQDISETVIFPVLPSQRSGVEDLRLVHFTDDGGAQSVIGTYTAYDGAHVRQEMIRGVDLRTFEMRALDGKMTGYKGMALFPRRIDGKYVMLGRQDNENIWLLTSDSLNLWETGKPIMGPKYPWEFVQIGNCGSPIEIEEGWLVFTHGVGMIRGYCIGACLLDRDDPSRVLKRTPSPLIFPSAQQRGGYVPNVTYSCGALVHERRVLLPYAIADQYTAFATAKLDDLLSVMEDS